MKLTPQILGMYLGCQVQFGIKPELFYGCLVGVNIFDSGKALIDAASERIKHGMPINCSIAIVRPILRRLSDMTEEEAREFVTSQGWGPDLENIAIADNLVRIKDSRGQMGIQYFRSLRPDTFAYLLSKSFDLFGLIDANEAIDAKTLTK